MPRLLATLLSVLLAANACSALPSQEEAGGEGVFTVTVEQALARVEDVDDLVVLDVRTDEEYAEGHLPDAVQIDFYRDDFEARIAELDRDAPYLVYCSQGGRSGSTGGIMAELGFTDVADMTAGFPAWREAGNPVEP